MKKHLLQQLATLIGTLCLFGVPPLALALIAYSGDALVDLIPVDPADRHSALFAIEAIGAMTLATVAALIIGGLLFFVLFKSAKALHAKADRLEPAGALSDLPVLQNARVRVGLLVKKRGLSSVRAIERRYRG